MAYCKTTLPAGRGLYVAAHIDLYKNASGCRVESELGTAWVLKLELLEPFQVGSSPHPKDYFLNPDWKIHNFSFLRDGEHRHPPPAFPTQRSPKERNCYLLTKAKSSLRDTKAMKILS